MSSVEELEDYNNLMNGDELDRLSLLRNKLEYFFKDPIQKWRHKGTRPWKLVVQILKIVLFTSQLILFGQDMARFINYKEQMQVTLKQLFLKDWDPSADAIAYPGPYVPYAVYTKQDFINSINYAIRIYSNVTDQGLGQYGYPSNQSNIVSPIRLCLTNYEQADFDPSEFSYNFSMSTNTTCKTIENYADAGSDKWSRFDFREHIGLQLNFSSLVTSSLSLPLRTLIMEDATNGFVEIVCFELDMQIFYDNTERVGQIVISLSSSPKQIACRGKLSETIVRDFAYRRVLNVLIILFCITSCSLCSRSLWRAYKLMRMTERVIKCHRKRLGYSERLQFVDFWLVIIIVDDLFVGYATVIMTFYEGHLLQTDNYTLCSLLLGMGNFLSWSGLLRYLSFFRQYNLLIVTLRKSFVHVTRFMLCTTLIYCGFCFSGWIIFGPYHFKFRELSTTTECLFSLINGDDMFETFALLRSDIGSIWWASRIYLYIFVSLFIYVVLSLFIALIMDAYEMIKEYSENGFPKSRLEAFYLDGDLSKLRQRTN